MRRLLIAHKTDMSKIEQDKETKKAEKQTLSYSAIFEFVNQRISRFKN